MNHSLAKATLGSALTAALLAAPVATTPAFALASTVTAQGTSAVVIDEAYLSGGSAGAAFKNKFVELYNSSDSAVSLDGWSLQYRPATGTGAPGSVTALKGSIPAKRTFLVKGGTNSAASTAPELPTPDLDAPGFNPSGTSGTIVLARQATAVTLGTDSQVEPAGVADLLGYGTSNTYETKAATAPSSNTDVKALTRSGHADSNDNSADFSLSAQITPQPSAGSGTPDPEPTPDPTPSPGSGVSIADIQGTGDASPLAGQTVTTKGKVTARYATGGLNGYYIQTPGTGGDLTEQNHKASDAVFVYSPGTVGSVAIGDYVQVTGSVSEYFGQTQLNVTAASGLTKLGEAAPEVKPTHFALPASEAFRESLEGMLVAPEGDFTLSDNFSLNQYGELSLFAGKTVAVQPNAVAPYGTPENQAVAADNEARTIKLDDGATTNFLSNATTKAQPLPYLTAQNTVRVGAPVTFRTNVILGYGNSSWRFEPLEQLTPSNADTVEPVTIGNTRADVPNAVGGELKLASFNVLNFFPTTGDQLSGCTYYTDRAGAPVTVKGGCDARGAANQANYQRQLAKTVAAINGSGADVVTLMEMENSAKFGKNRDDALSKLVDALNAAAPGVWDYVRSPSTLPPLADEDVIRTAFIYKKAVAEPVGESIIHNDTVAFASARKPLAQVFKPVGGTSAQEFIAIANHFKSKSSAATPDDTDKGQGASNLARIAESKSLLGFVDSLEKAKGTDKVFLIGDFNAYSKEDPLNILTDAGFVDQDGKAKNADGSQKHSYLFSGLAGSLDHIFASPAAETMVNGADIWNINSVEPISREYSRWNYNVTDFYEANQFRNSDHDPVIVGINTKPKETSTTLNFLGVNDFHGRIDSNTVNVAGTLEKLRAAAAPGATAFVSAGDNIGASLFASSVAKDQPTIDVLNALGLTASAVGNHEFDGGWADLRDRVAAGGANAKFPYLGANVYKKGTQEPVLPEYTVLDLNGVKVAVIGAVTQEVPTLVTPAGIADLDFGNPVDAVNCVAAKIKAGKLADVIVAEYHEGAGAGTPDGATLQQELAAGGAFAKIVNQTSSDVNAIFTGHTHKEYAWDAPVPGQDGKTRPVVQTGSYGENIGQIELTVDLNTKQVSAYSARNVARTKDAAAGLIAAYPRVKEVDGIVRKALADAAVVGGQAIGTVTRDVTTAFTKDPATGNPVRDDRASESTLGNLVADSLVASLKDPTLGGAEIGVVNPGGLRNELYYGTDGTITYAQANAVLPFVNNLWTTSLTGAQLKTMLEQQWQSNADGTIPSRPYLQLGLSKNVNYTYDAARAAGDRVTSILVNGQPVDPAKSYRIGTFSFLATGGDNFRIFKDGTNTRDSGLVDRDAWMAYLKGSSPVSPDFARRSVAVSSSIPASVKPGDALNATVSKLDLTSLGSPVNTSLTATFTDASGKVTTLGTTPVTSGTANVSLTVPAGAAAGAGTLVLKATESGTTVTLTVIVEKVANPNCTKPEYPKNFWAPGQMKKYERALKEYEACLKG
ncbi:MULTISPECIES: ExeM/NucH family extracellular endonuclease [Arthrobacter]|uniref:ExeM/NucH family extracellular endonuclease n=2 Tax=Arthrobacter TaxID=1663 RepID=A0ABU9KIU9_9MICC|nr:ExeM/NucH family extracellular endonuclease [Arthrobacter sp. YJM1]MDP5226671.1 ExeM/NucH family extracellular endonuclease [Arthrobacter sp. YJM1]